MLTSTTAFPSSSTQYICYAGTPHNDTDFNGTIATLPGGAVLTYNVVSGDENVLHPLSVNMLAKLRLYNSTRSTYGLISTAVLGTNTITLTAAVPGAWQVGDVITVRSQTNTYTAGGAYFMDFEFTSAELPELTRYIGVDQTIYDGGAANQRQILHPWAAYNSSKVRLIDGQVAGLSLFRYSNVQLIQKRFTLWQSASGAGVGVFILQLADVYVATP